MGEWQREGGCVVEATKDDGVDWLSCLASRVWSLRSYPSSRTSYEAGGTTSIRNRSHTSRTAYEVEGRGDVLPHRRQQGCDDTAQQDRTT